MSNEFDQAAGGGVGLAFLLSEIRDLRKGMETRDESLRGGIDSVRDSVNVLSAKVDRSQGDVDNVQKNVEVIREEMGSIRDDVDIIMKERSEDVIKKESEWAGPRRVIKIIVTIGGLAVAIAAIANFWPVLGPWLATVTITPS